MATIKVEGMSCEHCVRRVTETIENVPGTSNVKVDLEAGKASFDQSGSSTIEDVIKAVKDAGYHSEA